MRKQKAFFPGAGWVKNIKSKTNGNNNLSISSCKEKKEERRKWDKDCEIGIISAFGNVPFRKSVLKRGLSLP